MMKHGFSVLAVEASLALMIVVGVALQVTDLMPPESPWALGWLTAIAGLIYLLHKLMMQVLQHQREMYDKTIARLIELLDRMAGDKNGGEDAER